MWGRPHGRPPARRPVDRSRTGPSGRRGSIDRHADTIVLAIRVGRLARTNGMSRYEQPDYEIVATSNPYEIRRYEPYLAAETTVAGDFDSTGNTAFRRLAGFIFGRNSAGVKMSMTVPVTREALGPAGYRYRFVMEKAYSEHNLPQPVDDSVAVVRVPGGYYAALRYRGRRNEALYRRVEKELLEALARDGVVTAGKSVNAVYNGPMTPPMLRRNEVLVPVVWAGPSAA